RRDGAAALAHGNRGRPPAHSLPEGLRTAVLDFAQGTYRGCNDSHLVELLAEREALSVSRATFQRWRSAAGLKSPRKRRPPKHRSRRERMPQPGLLLQWDASLHAWLGERGPRFTLVGAIDDATGEVLAVTFRWHEDAQGYLLVLRTILSTKGIPVAIYRDRHGIFEQTGEPRWTLEEELAGQRVPTQVGRALAELGIGSIPASSPQAKGRIERLWGTFQDRLVQELRLAGAATMEEAEALLPSFLVRFNRRFMVPAVDPTAAYRPLPASVAVDAVCCLAYERTVAADNTISFGGQQWQLQPTAGRVSYVRVTVIVREHLDGSITVSYQGVTIATRLAPPTAPVLRARKGRRPALLDLSIPRTKGHGSSVPGPNHPWRKETRTKSLSS
ncbi:MAG: ISNCY family transposase, partial [Chloroflexota bacterium]